MMQKTFLGSLGFIFLFGFLSTATLGHAAMIDVKRAYDSKQYFSAARLAYNDATHIRSVPEKAMSFAWVTKSLVRAGLDQSALYFFFRTLSFKDRASTLAVLDLAPFFFERAGPDALRGFLRDFKVIPEGSVQGRSVFSFIQMKEFFSKGDYQSVIKASSGVSSKSAFYPLMLQLRGISETMVGKGSDALRSFQECERYADRYVSDSDQKGDEATALDLKWIDLRKDAGRDLKARCLASQARLYFETGNFLAADKAYDRIPKASLVWPETLIEHAWTTFKKEEYNRTLGKLVSYQSEALSFVLNPEVDLLSAQSYLNMCKYVDSKNVLDRMVGRYAPIAKEVKSFIESNTKDWTPYYQLGRQTLSQKLHTSRNLYRFVNRFARGPYFQTLVLAEERAQAERIAVERLDRSRKETQTGPKVGFPGFLNQVLNWRLQSLRNLGGVFIRNSMLDFYGDFISDIEKAQFMKIDVLSKQRKKVSSEQGSKVVAVKKNRIPVRRKDQMLWIFNGEFWNDEIGDYVFAMESDCESQTQDKAPSLEGTEKSLKNSEEIE